MLVLDASAAVMFAAAEPGSERVDALMEAHCLIAPDLLLAEVANALWRKARLHVLTADDTLEALLRMRLAVHRYVPCAELAGAALHLALRRSHPVYGAFYVALAQRETVPLLTADRRLAERFADDARIELVA